MFDDEDDYEDVDDYYYDEEYEYPCQCSFCVGFRAGYRAALRDMGEP